MADLLVLSLTVAGHQLQDPANGYEVVSYGPGPRAYRRSTVESEDVAGRVLVAYALEQSLGHVAVRVKASDDATLKTRYDTLIGWFDGIDYTITATLASTKAAGNWVESWTCEPADSEPGDGGMLDAERLYNFQQEVTFSWPHNPVPL